MVAYSIGKDNEVTKTTEITNDGIRETAGGEVGHIPSAPKGWKAGETFGVYAGGKRGQTKPGKTGEANEKAAKGKTPTPAMASTKAAGKDLKEEPGKRCSCIQERDILTSITDKGAADQMSGPKTGKATNDFGAAFKKNLRDAFAS